MVGNGAVVVVGALDGVAVVAGGRFFVVGIDAVVVVAVSEVAFGSVCGLL